MSSHLRTGPLSEAVGVVAVPPGLLGQILLVLLHSLVERRGGHDGSRHFLAGIVAHLTAVHEGL